MLSLTRAVTCELCNHSKADHGQGRSPCFAVDQSGECNCDSWITQPLTRSIYCDDCLQIAGDMVGTGAAEQAAYLDLMADLIQDHDCSASGETGIRCDCLGHEWERDTMTR